MKKTAAFLLALALAIVSAFPAFAVKLDGKKKDKGVDDGYLDDYRTILYQSGNSGNNIDSVTCYTQADETTLYVLFNVVYKGVDQPDNNTFGVIIFADGQRLEADLSNRKYDSYDKNVVSYRYYALRRTCSYSIEAEIIFKNGIHDPQEIQVKFVDGDGVESAIRTVAYSGKVYERKSEAATTTKPTTTKATTTAKPTTTKQTTTKATTTAKPTTTKATTTKQTTTKPAKTTKPATTKKTTAPSTSAAPTTVQSTQRPAPTVIEGKTAGKVTATYVVTRETLKGETQEEVHYGAFVRDTSTATQRSGDEPVPTTTVKAVTTDEYTTAARAGSNKKIKRIAIAVVCALATGGACAGGFIAGRRKDPKEEQK
ncbi:MAG: hypothetical protein J5562_08835 [Clostridia bacterium]|nr:hypothetical protein [Clostridia bacterium]